MSIVRIIFWIVILSFLAGLFYLAVTINIYYAILAVAALGIAIVNWRR